MEYLSTINISLFYYPLVNYTLNYLRSGTIDPQGFSWEGSGMVTVSL